MRIRVRDGEGDSTDWMVQTELAHRTRTTDHKDGFAGVLPASALGPRRGKFEGRRGLMRVVEWERSSSDTARESRCVLKRQRVRDLPRIEVINHSVRFPFESHSIYLPYKLIGRQEILPEGSVSRLVGKIVMALRNTARQACVSSDVGVRLAR